MESEKEKAIKRLERLGYKMIESSEESRKSFDEVDYIKMLEDLLVKAHEDFGRSPLNLFTPEIILMHPYTFGVFAKQFRNIMMTPNIPGYPLRKQIAILGWVLDIYESLDIKVGKMIIK